MGEKTYKTIETPGGIGQITKAGKRLAKVFYRLQIRQEVIPGAPTTYGASEISGEMTVSQDEPMQSQVMKSLSTGEPLTLNLEDGRRLDVFVTRTSEFSDAFRVVPANGASLMAA
jgi:hypothetical protein